MADSITYLTRDEFAVFRNYADWDAFAADNDFPSQSTLNIYRETMYGIINTYIGTAVTKTNYLRNLEYKGVEMMITETQAKLAGEPRDFYMPTDYIHKRDRQNLDSLDSTLNRGVTSG